MARNLVDAVNKRALRDSRRIAIQIKRYGKWEKISYGELIGNIKSLSSALSHYYGVKHGDKAAVMLGNRPEWPIVFFALLQAGAIPVPVNPHGSRREIENILADSGCAIAFVESGCPDISVRSVSVDMDEFKGNLYLYPEAASAEEPGRGDDACIMYTSGTTANPKGIVLSHGNLLSNMRSLYRLGLMKPGEGIVSVLPLYHTYAMVVTTLGPLVYGGRIIYPGSIRSKEVIRSIKESKASLFIGVPLIFEMFHRRIKDSLRNLPAPIRVIIESLAEALYFLRKKTGVNLARYLFYGIHATLGRSLRVCMSGGARLKEDVERDLFKYGFTILNGYGLTETSPVVTVNPLRRPKIGSVGLPIADVRIRIDNKDSKGHGEIVASGPNVMKGYYRNAELTRQVIDEGWFRTGDIGYLDEDGYLFIVGRVNDAIAFGTGLSISPDEVEDVYMEAVPVKELCIFDIPSPRGIKDVPVLWAVAVPDIKSLKANAIKDPYYAVKTAFEDVSRSLSICERIMGFSLTLDMLPRTLMGKVKRRDVKRMYLSGEIKEAFPSRKKELAPADRQLMQRPEAVKIVDCIRAQTGIDQILPDDSFEMDLGIDLVGRAELASRLEEKLGLKIGEDLINRVFTVRELIDHMKRLPRDSMAERYDRKDRRDALQRP